MAAATICEFLGSSTIHGLVHISTAKSRIARALWLAIVVACFAFAIHMITSSYKEWQESPVSTTITTHPITELDFPAVTVCPPRRSNTAINHLLQKVKDVNFTERERDELLNKSKEIFLENPNQAYAWNVVKMLSTGNMRSLIYNQMRMPQTDEYNVTHIKSFKPQGSLRTPSFGDPGHFGDFDRRNRSIH